jgi:hypothetical protein
MRPPKHPWPDTDGSRGTLMFAQLMSEMLNPLSFESFRVHTLCSVARLDEAYAVVEDVRRDRIHKLALVPVLAELNWSLEKDPVAKGAAEQEIESLGQLTKSNQYNFDELSSHVLLLRKKIGKRYKSDLEKLLIEKFEDSGHRIEFRRTAGFYCSHLINIGYSKPHIAKVIEDEFFLQPVRRTGRSMLRRLFKRFSSHPSKYVVYAAISQDFGAFLRSLGISVLPANKVAHTAAAAISGDPDLTEVAIVKRKAFDEYGAMVSVHQVFTNVRALTYLAPQGMPCKWGGAMYVVRERSNVGSTQERIDVSFDKPITRKRTSARQYRGIKGYSERIFKHFDRSSTERLLASIATSALARTTSNIENQLISLWSAVEVLLSEPPTGTARIVHYSKLLVPCICMRHVRRQFAAACDELLISYKRKFKDIIAQQSAVDTVDFHTRFASVMLMPQHEAQRTQLLQLCKDNPLALHRLFHLNADFKTPKTVVSAVASHEKRVEWQVHRIYRARNNLVHAGRMPTYRDSLLVNLFEYYRSSIGTIVNHARRQDERSDVDQVVAEVGIDYEIFKRHFKSRGSDALDSNDLRRLLF